MSFMKGLFNKLFGNNNSTTIIDTENTSSSPNHILAKPSTNEKMKKETEHEAMEQKSIQPACKEPRFKLGDGFYFEFDTVSNGYGGYRMINVYLLNVDDPSFERCIVNRCGEIENFPGIEEGKWMERLERPLSNKTKFRFWIYKYKDGKASVEWTLQPDGRYFEDEDGFGGENCEEITLYSSIDTNGFFTEPFKYR